MRLGSTPPSPLNCRSYSPQFELVINLATAKARGPKPAHPARRADEVIEWGGASSSGFSAVRQPRGRSQRAPPAGRADAAHRRARASAKSDPQGQASGPQGGSSRGMLQAQASTQGQAAGLWQSVRTGRDCRQTCSSTVI
jgi:hypothetical protein